MSNRGKVFAIEGGDGSGKATQAELTAMHASENLGKVVMKRSFPRYGEPSAQLVERYLDGEFGDIYSVPAEFVSLAFAADRLAGTQEIREHVGKGPNHIVILDRYVLSNAAHQAAKFQEREKRFEFYDWILRTEFEDMGMLQPDKNIVLLVPPNVSHENVANKGERSYTDKTHDIHEADLDYQGRVKLAYEELCDLFPDRCIPINCVDETGNMRPKEDIQADIQEILGLKGPARQQYNPIVSRVKNLLTDY